MNTLIMRMLGPVTVIGPLVLVILTLWMAATAPAHAASATQVTLPPAMLGEWCHTQSLGDIETYRRRVIPQDICALTIRPASLNVVRDACKAVTTRFASEEDREKAATTEEDRKNDAYTVKYRCRLGDTGKVIETEATMTLFGQVADDPFGRQQLALVWK